VYLLRLKSIRGDDSKLRRLIKVLLRSHGWRCVSISIAAPHDGGAE
jgi:hypothetical protein